MPIDPDLLEKARELHDDLEAMGLDGYAFAVRLAVSKAVDEQEQEEAFGPERLLACIESQLSIGGELAKMASTRPLTNGAISDHLETCVPHVQRLASAADGPRWYWAKVGPAIRTMSRLAESLKGTDPRSNASSAVHVRIADCVRHFGQIESSGG